MSDVVEVNAAHAVPHGVRVARIIRLGNVLSKAMDAAADRNDWARVVLLSERFESARETYWELASDDHLCTPSR